jgi:hypothetical protein
MAKTVVAFELTANGSQAEGSVKSLKAQIKEANIELIAMQEQFGKSSEQAINAAKKVAALKDTIQDAKEQADLFDPGNKFKAFSNAASQVAAGFTAVQGAMALVGSESEDVQKSLLKVQGALALSQGLSQLGDLGKAFDEIKIVAVNAFRTIKTAIGSTGIGLLVIAIGEVVMAMKDWYDSTQNQISAEERLKQKEEDLKQSIEDTNNEIKKRNELNDYLQNAEIISAKARGSSLKELRGIEDKYFTDSAFDYQEKIRRAEKEVDRLKSEGFVQAEIIKENGEKVKTALGIALDQENNLREESAKIWRAKELRDANRKLEDYNTDVANNKERNDKIIADNKRVADANKAQNDLQKKLQDEITLSLIANERDRAATKLEMDLENAKRDIERSDASTKEKNESIALLERQFMVNLSSMKEKWAEEDKQKQLQKQQETDDAIISARLAAITDENFKRQAEIDINRQAEIDKQAEAYNNQLISLEQYLQAVNGINFKYDKQLTDNAATEAENRKKIAEAEKATKLEFYDAIGAGFGALSNLFEQGTAANKAFALAEIAIGTGTGFIKGLQIAQNSASALGPGSVYAFPVFYATQIAAVLSAAARARNILKTVKGGGGGGGTPASMPRMNAPLTPQVQTTNLNQGQINQLASATSRAFVLESDVSGSQERIRRINRAARIN